MTGLFGGKMAPNHIGCFGASLFVIGIVAAVLGMVWIVGRGLELF